MPEQNKPFVVTDRRKFTADGAPRPDADPSPAKDPRPETLVTEPTPPPPAVASPEIASEPSSENALPEGPTPEQMEQARLAYQSTADRLDTAIRSANPGMDHPPAMTFDQIVQSIYMSSIMQLGGNTPESQQPQ